MKVRKTIVISTTQHKPCSRTIISNYTFDLMSIPLFTIGTLVINIIYFVLLDRLMMAAVQRRTGPYNVGYFGLLQPMDDGLKLVKNEVIIPKKSSCILFLVVPNLFFYCSLILFTSLSMTCSSTCSGISSFKLVFTLSVILSNSVSSYR